MEQLNKTPTTGKFGDVAKTIDTNFGLIVTKLMELSEASKAKEMNCGFYSSEAELKTAYPNPDKGMMAYVGSGTDYTVYRCKTDGTWTATSETFKVNISVDLSTYATKDALAQVKGSVDNSIHELDKKLNRNLLAIEFDDDTGYLNAIIGQDSTISSVSTDEDGNVIIEQEII